MVCIASHCIALYCIACCGTIAVQKLLYQKERKRLKTENSYEFDRIISSFAHKFGSLSWWNCPFAKVFVGSLLDLSLWPSNKSLWVAPKVLIHVKYTLYNTWDIDHSWDQKNIKQYNHTYYYYLLLTLLHLTQVFSLTNCFNKKFVTNLYYIKANKLSVFWLFLCANRVKA